MKNWLPLLSKNFDPLAEMVAMAEADAASADTATAMLERIMDVSRVYYVVSLELSRAGGGRLRTYTVRINVCTRSEDRSW